MRERGSESLKHTPSLSFFLESLSQFVHACDSFIRISERGPKSLKQNEGVGDYVLKALPLSLILSRESLKRLRSCVLGFRQP